MSATQPSRGDQIDGEAVLGPLDAPREDAFWRRHYQRERYYSRALNYEDYAPAYCVGYVGYAQYGGDYEEAEKSLCANWLRIKGDSRLSLDAARLVMRAAWDRMARQAAQRAAGNSVSLRASSLRPTRARMPSFKLGFRPPPVPGDRAEPIGRG